MRSAADLTSVVTAGRELSFLLLLQYHGFLSHLDHPPLFRERRAHESEKLFCFLVGGSRSYENDIHSANLVDLVVLDLGEDQLLLDTQSKVAAAWTS